MTPSASTSDSRNPASSCVPLAHTSQAGTTLNTSVGKQSGGGSKAYKRHRSWSLASHQTAELLAHLLASHRNKLTSAQLEPQTTPLAEIRLSANLFHSVGFMTESLPGTIARLD